MSCCSCWPSTPSERSLGESRNEALRTEVVGNWQNRFSDGYFLEPILSAQFLYLLISRKALTFFMVRNSPRDQQKASAKKICAWLHGLPLHQNYIYTDLPPTFLEQFLWAIWNTISWAIVLILPQVKLHLQLLHCAYLFIYFLSLQCSWAHLR